VELLHLGIAIPEGAYLRNSPVTHTEDSNSLDGKPPATYLCAFKTAQARATTGEATNNFVAFGDAFLDDIVQVRKGLSGHEKKSLQPIHAIHGDERTPVSYVLSANLVCDAEVASIEKLLEVTARQRFVHI
jgi:hypothetical protein